MILGFVGEVGSEGAGGGLSHLYIFFAFSFLDNTLLLESGWRTQAS